jgi:hypothetical protein
MAESPVIVAGISLAAAMALIGLRPARGRAEAGGEPPA